MIQLSKNGAYFIDNTELIEVNENTKGHLLNKLGNRFLNKPEAIKNTIAYQILQNHNTSNNMDELKIKFDKLTSHDITYVGIIQTAMASGLEKFPIPYVLTNCHNSLCAVGGTINEDDHVFGLTAAKKYGGLFVPPHQAVIHQYAREQMASCGQMILGSDSHTRYGALGTMAIGEGGPELVKQLLSRTYDINMPEIIGIYMTGSPQKGVGPQDVALAIIGAVFKNGFVNNKVMEFIGPGIKNLSADYRIGIDVMTTETTCLSSIWQTDDEIKDYYQIHNRLNEYKELTPGEVTYYNGIVYVELDKIQPMIALPFHPSNTYTINELNANLLDILADCEKKAQVSLDGKVEFSLKDKVQNRKLYVEQGIIAGCAGGGFENICAASDILKGKNIGSGEFTLSIYPASTPIYMELVKNNTFVHLLAAGAVIKTAFCGPCFGAGDTPSNNALSIRHVTRNFPNREGSKIQNGQISSVALMDARSIAATAANKGYLTAATDIDVEYQKSKYFFDKTIYENRIFDSQGISDLNTDIKFGPNIKKWPKMSHLTNDLILKVVSVITDPVTTTDELIPSGETSSYRSNPIGLAEFTLSRKDPGYVGRAKEVQAAENARINGLNPLEFFKEIEPIITRIKKAYPDINIKNTGIGSTIYATKPGDGSAREQAASCQKVLGGWANLAKGYATKRYRSNLINWGMLPFVIDSDPLPFSIGDYLFIPGIAEAIKNKNQIIKAYVVKDSLIEFDIKLGHLTDDERDIILAGCLINYYKNTTRE